MPVDRSAIDRQLREIGEGDRWWEQREFRDLPHILSAEETIVGINTGWLLKPHRPRLLPAAPWLVVATNQRLICLQQERFGRKQVDIPVGQIISMHHRTRLRSCRITIETLQRKYRIRIPKGDAFRFLGVFTTLIPQTAIQSASSGITATARLPGMAGIAVLPGLAGLASRVSALPAPDYVRRAELTRVEANVERLENEIERLQQQVDFLEKLLQQRTDGMLSLTKSSVDS